MVVTSTETASGCETYQIEYLSSDNSHKLKESKLLQRPCMNKYGGKWSDDKINERVRMSDTDREDGNKYGASYIVLCPKGKVIGMVSVYLNEELGGVFMHQSYVENDLNASDASDIIKRTTSAFVDQSGRRDAIFMCKCSNEYESDMYRGAGYSKLSEGIFMRKNMTKIRFKFDLYCYSLF